MTEQSIEHRIRVAIGKAFHHKHQTQAGTVDLQNIAAQHGVSEDQVKEQMAYLRSQNLLDGPLAAEGEQIADVPITGFGDYQLTEEGLAWVEAGYNYL